MNRFSPPVGAPASWKLSFHYDRMEVFGEEPRSGYARAYLTRRTKTLELVGKFVSPPAKILDIAAAQGNFSLALAELGYDVTWNDLRAELAEYVEKKRAFGRVSYRPGNAFELKFDGRFDLVLITEVIEHVAHPDEFLKNAARLLAPGGIIVMSTPNGGYFRNRLPRFSECADASRYEAVQFRPDADGHIFLLHEDEVHQLASEAGLDVLALSLFNFPLTTGALGTQRVLPMIPLEPVRIVERAAQRLPVSIGRRILTGMAAVFKARSVGT